MVASVDEGRCSMGTYKIEITGAGPHHNGGQPYDADIIARVLVLALKASGHENVKGRLVLTDSNGVELREAEDLTAFGRMA